ncbi:MAG TPA: hypothetical protein VLS48_04440, partial [Anaerolineales bacterium]|nr:hypothetical protein [Anaerolineales bacterium]
MRNRKLSIWIFGLLLVLALTLGACAEAGQNEPGDDVGIVEPETTAVLTEDVTMDDEAPLATEDAVLPATGNDNLARLEAMDGLTVQT